MLDWIRGLLALPALELRAAISNEVRDWRMYVWWNLKVSFDSGWK